ncbi:metallopeptidase family protein [Actinoplanes sp. TBRC 11911]|uniref:metallopeptidase family protein n=1 Tax=Actinoplanes sp. TBRC 11911 TaxID=2729386 RepID=UPI001B7D6955|nr:metallopeptidase family protein [Actinoplanes sp. TBRC 11911]
MNAVPVDMSRERFEELVGEALDEVPQELMSVMNNVVFMVEDSPPGGGDGLLGLYEGTALTDRGWNYAGVLPDRITIYRLPTLQICDTEDDVIDEVAITVVHEIAHHFGIDEHRLHELGWG